MFCPYKAQGGERGLPCHEAAEQRATPAWRGRGQGPLRRQEDPFERVPLDAEAWYPELADRAPRLASRG